MALLPASESLAIASNDLFTQVVAATVATVAPRSAQIYRQTFMVWHKWCVQQQLDPLGLMAAQVREFLLTQAVSCATRKRILSALRKLARIAALDYTAPARRAAYESLLLLRAPQEGVRDTVRQHRALTPGQTTRVLDTWDKNSLIHARNRALVALLFLTGIRRAEAAALRWDDIDLDEALIQIRHGKGDKPRLVVIAGQESVQTLRAWRHAQGAARAYVFCRIGKGNRLGPDTPITDQAVYDVVKRTERRSGITFSPHDARRTFITEALSNGAPLADVQAQAGHKNESTTLRYAQPVDAQARRSRLKLRYG